MINESKILNDLSSKKLNLKVDVIFQCGSTPGIFLKNKKSKEFLILWNPDGVEWKRKKFPWYGRAVLYYSSLRGIKLSDAIIIDNKSLIKTYERWAGRKPIYYVPSGSEILDENLVNKKYLEEFGLKEKDYYLIVARAVPENHILEIINFFLETPTEKKLLLVSNLSQDRYSKKIYSLISKNRNKILYFGPIYDRNKINTLRFYSFAYIHGHSVGGTNPSLLESMGAGVPSICFDVEYNREVARNSALYFRDKESFSNSVKKLETNYDLYQNMSKRAVEIIKESFLWDYIVELHEAVAMHSLAYYNKINKNDYFNFIDNLKFRDKFVERGFYTFDRILY